MTNFDKFNLNEMLLKAIKEQGFDQPTPVQEKAIPFLIEHSRDLIALAQTGTGKTAAFGLPIIHEIAKNSSNNKPKAIVLCPTRELCLQIVNEFKKFGKYLPKVRITGIYGGAPIDAQLKSLQSGVDIVIATPGRMNDVIRRNKVDLSDISTVVLDEADEMLQMGFKDELNYILDKTPESKRTLLFSATMPREAATIAMDYMYDPYEIISGEKNKGSQNIRHVYYTVLAKNKYRALKRILDANPDLYGIIFCRTRIETKQIAESLSMDGYDVEALHGDLSHQQRESVMKKFRKKHLQILVATDVAARGLDVTDITHSVNYNLPEELEVYTHRSGRTGRAGKKGISFCIISSREEGKIRRIEKLIGQKFEKGIVPSGDEVMQKQIEKFGVILHNVSVKDKLIDNIEEKLLSAVISKSNEKDTDKTQVSRDIFRKLLYLQFRPFFEQHDLTENLNDESKEKYSSPNKKDKRRNQERYKKDANKQFNKRKGPGKKVNRNKMKKS